MTWSQPQQTGHSGVLCATMGSHIWRRNVPNKGQCGASKDIFMLFQHHLSLLIQASHVLTVEGYVVPELDFTVTYSGIVVSRDDH